jgi:hypothetical protein
LFSLPSRIAALNAGAGKQNTKAHTEVKPKGGAKSAAKASSKTAAPKKVKVRT